MDPSSPKHLLTGGRQIVETTSGAQTGSSPGDERRRLQGAEAGTSHGWHKVPAHGVTIDPRNPKVVYVTLGAS
ncbi:MAG TPA: hypothetical protein VEP94_03090, partial [Solirubrobacterales bacterium]|nr:hypothetical protein [Solirubrobacterales bacterium]